MENYADEIRADVAHYHGKRFVSTYDHDYVAEMKEADKVWQAMTEDERNAIRYLSENNREELHALYVRVKERAGL